jgi:hypothetical protein
VAAFAAPFLGSEGQTFPPSLVLNSATKMSRLSTAQSQADALSLRGFSDIFVRMST